MGEVVYSQAENLQGVDIEAQAGWEPGPVLGWPLARSGTASFWDFGIELGGRLDYNNEV